MPRFNDRKREGKSLTKTNRSNGIMHWKRLVWLNRGRLQMSSLVIIYLLTVRNQAEEIMHTLICQSWYRQALIEHKLSFPKIGLKSGRIYSMDRSMSTTLVKKTAPCRLTPWLSLTAGLLASTCYHEIWKRHCSDSITEICSLLSENECTLELGSGSLCDSPLSIFQPQLPNNFRHTLEFISL